MNDAFNSEEAITPEKLKGNTIVTPAQESPTAPESFKDQDATGTGTFPPNQQGTVNRSQPAGLSAQTQYGEPTAKEVQGEKPVATPITGPEMKESDVNKDVDNDEEDEDEDA